MITDPQNQKDRWKEHFTELLNPPLSSINLDDLDNVPEQPNFGYLSCIDGPPTRDEISDTDTKTQGCHITCLARHYFTNEQLKFGERGLIHQLEHLFAKVWKDEVTPDDWLKGVIIIIGKKGDTSYCDNNRGITLRATVSKLLQMIILKRLDKGMKDLLRENQCGFRQQRHNS